MGGVNDFSDLLLDYGEPPGQRMLERPWLAQVQAETYAGQIVTLALYVIAVADGFVCVAQPRPSAAAWNAWIPSGRATPA